MFRSFFPRLQTISLAGLIPESIRGHLLNKVARSDVDDNMIWIGELPWHVE